jgi:hypothetical protein
MRILPSPSGVTNDNAYNKGSYTKSGIYKHPSMFDQVLIVSVNPSAGCAYCIPKAVLEDALGVEQEQPANATTAHPHITPADLLRAVAISQKPDLATTLLHPSMQ